MMPEERALLPESLRWDVREHASRYDLGLPCLWFDIEAKRCSHYEHRPDACRTAVMPGDEHCNGFRTAEVRT